MKTFTLILALVLCSVMVQAQITQPYQLTKYIYNGTSAYTTGKTLGAGPDSLDTWPVAPDSVRKFFAQHPGKWIMLQNIVLADSLAQNASLEMWIMDKRTGSLVDDSTFGLSWSDLQHCIGVIPFGTVYYSAGTGSINMEPNVNVMLKAPIVSYVNLQPPRYWYVYFICRSSKTWTVAKTLKLSLQLFWQ